MHKGLLKLWSFPVPVNLAGTFLATQFQVAKSTPTSQHRDIGDQHNPAHLHPLLHTRHFVPGQGELCCLCSFP